MYVCMYVCIYIYIYIYMYIGKPPMHSCDMTPAILHSRNLQYCKSSVFSCFSSLQ